MLLHLTGSGTHPFPVWAMEPFTATSNPAIGGAPPRTQTQSLSALQHLMWRLRSHAAAEHSARQTASPRTSLRLQAVTDRLASQASLESTLHANQIVRDGHYESSLVAEQVFVAAPSPRLSLLHCEIKNYFLKTLLTTTHRLARQTRNSPAWRPCLILSTLHLAW